MSPRKTARDLVADDLRQRILDGSLPPGYKLGVARVATALDVSHTPTREALQLLAAEGLVQINAFRGSVVADLSANEYEEIFLMRVGLEELASRLGSERIDDDGIERMTAQFASLERAAADDDIDAFVEVDRAFHETHYLASGRQSLWDRIISLRRAAERYTRLGYRLPGVGMAETIDAHRRLLAAVSQRDGKAAAREMATDLNRTFNAIHAQLLREEADRAQIPQHEPGRASAS